MKARVPNVFQNVNEHRLKSESLEKRNERWLKEVNLKRYVKAEG